jgi:hypothetical protein
MAGGCGELFKSTVQRFYLLKETSTGREEVRIMPIAVPERVLDYDAGC